MVHLLLGSDRSFQNSKSTALTVPNDLDLEYNVHALLSFIFKGSKSPFKFHLKNSGSLLYFGLVLLYWMLKSKQSVIELVEKRVGMETVPCLYTCFLIKTKLFPFDLRNFNHIITMRENITGKRITAKTVDINLRGLENGMLLSFTLVNVSLPCANNLVVVRSSRSLFFPERDNGMFLLPLSISDPSLVVVTTVELVPVLSWVNWCLAMSGFVSFPSLSSL